MNNKKLINNLNYFLCKIKTRSASIINKIKKQCVAIKLKSSKRNENISKNINIIIGYYYNGTNTEKYSSDIEIKYGPPNRYLYLISLPIFPSLIDRLDLNLDNNKYKFLYINTNQISSTEFVSLGKEHYKSDHFIKIYMLHMLIIKLAIKMNIYFCFYNNSYTFIEKDGRPIQDNYNDLNAAYELLICVDTNYINGLVEEVNKYSLENKLDIFTKVSDDGLYFFKKQHFGICTDFGPRSDRHLFYSLNYNKELNDYYLLGYYSNKADLSLDMDLLELLKDDFLSYVTSTYEVSLDNYLTEYNKSINNYPYFIKDTNIELVRYNNFKKCLLKINSLVNLKITGFFSNFKNKSDKHD